MSETTLQARLSIASGANAASPKKAWKKPPRTPSYSDNRASWPSRCSSSSSGPEDASQPSIHGPPSILERIGPKIDPPTPRRSLLERMELGDTQATTQLTGSTDYDFIPLGSNCPVRRGGNGGELVDEVDGVSARSRSDGHYGGEDSEVRPGSDVLSTPFRFSGRQYSNGFAADAQSRTRTPSTKGTMTNGHRDAYRDRKTEAERVNSPAAVGDSIPTDSASDSSMPNPNKAPENFSTNDPTSSVQSDTVEATSSQHRSPLPLQARIGRALRFAVRQNAQLREKSGTTTLDKDKDKDKVQSKIDALVTETVSASFEAQMRKVKREMDASRPGLDETMARAKDDLLNDFGNKSGGGSGGYASNTWLNRRDSRSLVPSIASTSILPTPPPSEFPTTESMEKPPPKAPRAMLGVNPPIPPKSISIKGKEKATEPPEDGGMTRERRGSYTSNSLRAEPMQNSRSGSVPRSARSAHRRASASPSRSPLEPRRRGFGDEMPTYRSPSRSRMPHSPVPRRDSFRSRSRSPIRTDSAPRDFTARQGFRSPSRSPARTGRQRSLGSRSGPRRAVSHTRSFNSRKPSFRSSVSRSPPPSAPYSNGFRRRSRSHSVDRGRTFLNKRPPHHSASRSPNLNSRHPYDKRPFVRSPSPFRGRRGASRTERRSRSPPLRKRKLTHPSPPRSRSPFAPRNRSSSLNFYGPDFPPRGPPPLRPGIYTASDSTPKVRHPAYVNSPRQLASPFGLQPPPPSALPRERSPPSAPTNPCNNVPGLWFVKVGANTSRVVECKFVVEPGFATFWDVPPPPPSSTPEAGEQLPQSKVSIVLLCLSTADVSALYTSLSASNPTAESMAVAIAGLQTAWPQDGMLFLDINREASCGKAWVPYDIDVASPLEVTNYIQPGTNVVRFIQLTSMVERTFILYASRRESEPDPSDPPPRDEVDARLFDDAVSAKPDNPLFNFSATVTLS